tara:strand:- start:1066 stop:1752 length:687 start_codon:yes stop_codon:yes gene_type:complete
LVEEIEESRKQYGSSHPDVTEYDKYKKLYSNKSKANANKNRHCSYCSSLNHNIRTCKRKEKDIIKLKKLNAQWRTNILNQLKEKGIGVGSIMTNHSYVSNIENSKSPWTLVNVDWDNLNWIVDNKRSFRLILMSNPAVFREITLEQVLNDSPSYIHRWNVLSKSEILDLPERWSTVSDTGFDSQLVELFKGINKYDYDTLFLQFYDNPIKYLNVNQEDLQEDLYDERE